MGLDDLASATSWINSPPLRFTHELAGQIVLLHFWAYTCVHSVQVLHELERLKRRYEGRPFVVVSVHVGKYRDERAAVAAAVDRLQIQHPVVIDDARVLWDAYSVSNWPTMVLLDARGQIVGSLSGEGHRALLESAIDRTFAAAQTANSLASAPFQPPPATFRPLTVLVYPARILADRSNDRLIVLDSGHHRILVSNWPDSRGNARVRQIIGTGSPGAADGDLGTASFCSPQGAALQTSGRGQAANILWIADTGNHLVRRIDLATGRVVTVLGTGEAGFENEAGKSGREQPLNSPRDVAVFGNRLYLSQAGQHQIFAMNLMTGMAEVAAGTARQGMRNGEAARAHLAEPSGLALDAGSQALYFADAENSALRALDLRQRNVTTIIGEGLYEFGDLDGSLQSARLQHPLGVSLYDNATKILIADTGNHKIKCVDLLTRTVHAVGGEGLFEPMSVAAGEGDAGMEIIVADTNHHRIVRLKGEAWEEIRFTGLSA